MPKCPIKTKYFLPNLASLDLVILTNFGAHWTWHEKQSKNHSVFTYIVLLRIDIVPNLGAYFSRFREQK